ncbi:MAG: alpha/beta hydrolase [Planctomycetota bacterium]
MLREQIFRAGEIDLNYAEGPPSGPPLVLLHGVTRCWQDFLTVIPTLAYRWQVFALDFRGHGRSGRGNGNYLVLDYARDVVRFLRERLDEPAVVFGHSLGGLVTAAVAAEAPERVRATILEDPPFRSMGKTIGQTYYREMFRAFQELAGSGLAIDELVNGLAEIAIQPPRSADRVRLADIRDPASLRFSAKGLSQMDPDVLTPVIDGRWLEGYDLEQILRSIACPSLLLQGNFNLGGALSDNDAELAAAWIRRCTFIRIREVGHLIHSLHTEATLRFVTAFLEST